METILAAAVTGLLSLAGCLASNRMAGQKMTAQLEKAQAVTDTELKELTREVREHNHFARRMPVVEEQVKAIHHRLEDLESYHKEDKYETQR